MSTLVIVDISKYEDINTYIDKLKGLLLHAEYDWDPVFIDIADYVLENHSNKYKSILCFDGTYNQIAELYTEALRVPSFEFQNNHYFEKSFNILLVGFNYSIADIYLSENKKTAWNTLKQFVKSYKSLNFNKPSFEFKAKNPVVKTEIVEVIQEVPVEIVSDTSSSITELVVNTSSVNEEVSLVINKALTQASSPNIETITQLSFHLKAIASILDNFVKEVQ